MLRLRGLRLRGLRLRGLRRRAVRTAAPPTPALAPVALAFGRPGLGGNLAAGFLIFLAGLVDGPGLFDLLDLLGRLLILIVHDRDDADRLHGHQRLRLLEAMYLLAFSIT